MRRSYDISNTTALLRVSTATQSLPTHLYSVTQRILDLHHHYSTPELFTFVWAYWSSILSGSELAFHELVEHIKRMREFNLEHTKLSDLQDPQKIAKALNTHLTSS
jgi:hypothetical protein